MMAPGMLYGGAAGAGAGAGDGVSFFDGALFQKQRANSSSSFLGSSSMVSFGNVNGGKKSRSFYDTFNQEDDEADEFGEYFHQAEKKRRLTENQVKFLEKSFEEENKLEPDRKVQLAKELGLQPRQIAIWFQNRRARWKTKQLERDYDALKNRYDSLKSDYNNLLKEKENLKAEVLQLNDKLLHKGGEIGQLAIRDSQSRSDALPNETKADPISRIEMSIVSAGVVNLQQEDLCSAKSDVLDSESPRYTDGVHSTLINQGDSAHVFEPEHSDVSQDDDENFRKTMVSTATLVAKAGDGDYPATSSNLSYFGFPVEDNSGFCFWSY